MNQCKHVWAAIGGNKNGIAHECALCDETRFQSTIPMTESRIREIVREEIRAAFECEGCDDRVFLYCRQCKTGHKP